MKLVLALLVVFTLGLLLVRVAQAEGPVRRDIRVTHKLELLLNKQRTPYLQGLGRAKTYHAWLRIARKWAHVRAVRSAQWTVVVRKWLPIHRCESDYWYYNGSSGFDGGLQFDPSTWLNVRSRWPELRLPAYAYQAEPIFQIAGAERWLRVTSWLQWPACSAQVGYR